MGFLLSSFIKIQLKFNPNYKDSQLYPMYFNPILGHCLM